MSLLEKMRQKFPDFNWSESTTEKGYPFYEGSYGNKTAFLRLRGMTPSFYTASARLSALMADGYKKVEVVRDHNASDVLERLLKEEIRRVDEWIADENPANYLENKYKES